VGHSVFLVASDDQGIDLSQFRVNNYFTMDRLSLIKRPFIIFRNHAILDNGPKITGSISPNPVDTPNQRLSVNL